MEEASAQLLPGEHLFAFHDDIYMVTMPERVGAVCAIMEEQLRTRAQIRIHGGKTGIVVERGHMRCVGASPGRGSDIPSSQQGIKVLGTPLGHVDFIAQHLNVTEEQRCLLERIPMVQDVQSAWWLLLLHCAAARANYQLRSTHPDTVEWYHGVAQYLQSGWGHTSFTRRGVGLGMRFLGYKSFFGVQKSFFGVQKLFLTFSEVKGVSPIV